MAELGLGGWTGIRVIELAGGDGRLCGQFFADAGADVITIESPPGGHEAARHPWRGDEPDPNRGPAFWRYSRGKRSLTLNLDAPTGQDLFRRLSTTADVIVEAISPGYLERLGCSFSVLATLSPSLILVSLSLFGSAGPDRDDVPQDNLSLHFGGLIEVDGAIARPFDRDRRFDSEAWEQAGRLAYLRAGQALERRKLTARGAKIEISLQEALILNDACPILHQVDETRDDHAHGSPVGESPGWMLECRDGRRLFASVRPEDRPAWQRLLHWLDGFGLAGPLTGVRLADGAGFERHLGLLYRVVQRFCRQFSADQVLIGARAAGLTWEAIDGGLAEFEIPATPSTWRPNGWLPRSSLVVGTPPIWPVTGQIPARGQHTSEILVGELGISPDELADLAANRVI